MCGESCAFCVILLGRQGTAKDATKRDLYLIFRIQATSASQNSLYGEFIFFCYLP